MCSQSVRNTNFLFEHSDLLEQTILVNKEYDEMHQSLREENNPQTFRTRKTNSVYSLLRFLHDGARTLTAARACG